MRRKRKNKSPSYFKFLLLCVVLLPALFITLNEQFSFSASIPTWQDIYAAIGLAEGRTYVPAEGTASVHFLDVGQGDAQLILTENHAVLIDTGEQEYDTEVIHYLNRQKVKQLDYVILTHPHSDHAGGFSAIADAFPPKRLILPDIQDAVIPTTRTYMHILETIERYEIEVQYAKPGDRIILDDAVLELIAPVTDYTDLNNYSVVCRFIHGENAFLFTGDIEQQAEEDILHAGRALSADVLKVAHHGSNSSSTRAFLAAVGGAYAVIGVGSPNSYGHPTEKTLQKLSEAGYMIFRTDKHSNICVTSDGTTLEFFPDKEEL